MLIVGEDGGSLWPDLYAPFNIDIDFVGTGNEEDEGPTRRGILRRMPSDIAPTPPTSYTEYRTLWYVPRAQASG